MYIHLCEVDSSGMRLQIQAVRGSGWSNCRGQVVYTLPTNLRTAAPPLDHDCMFIAFVKRRTHHLVLVVDTMQAASIKRDVSVGPAQPCGPASETTKTRLAGKHCATSHLYTYGHVWNDGTRRAHCLSFSRPGPLRCVRVQVLQGTGRVVADSDEAPTAFTIPLPLFPRIIEWYTKVRRYASRGYAE